MSLFLTLKFMFSKFSNQILFRQLSCVDVQQDH